MKVKSEFQEILEDILRDHVASPTSKEPIFSQVHATEEIFNSWPDFKVRSFYEPKKIFNLWKANANIKNHQEQDRESAQKEHAQKVRMEEEQRHMQKERIQNEQTQKWEEFLGEIRREHERNNSAPNQDNNNKNKTETEIGKRRSQQEKSTALRKLTFDQMQALKIFVSMGENKISLNSTDEEIKAAYRRLAKKYHPDLGFQTDHYFKKISIAYKKLSILK